MRTTPGITPRIPPPSMLSIRIFLPTLYNIKTLDFRI
jgi:hypothetical protein